MSFFAPIPSPSVLGESIVTNGLIGNYDAGNTASYPGTGTTCTDLSGTSNGTLLNGVGFDASDYNGAFIFDGSNDAIQVNNVAAHNFGARVSQECVFNWNGNNQSATICGKWGGSPWAEYTIGIWGWNGTERSGTGRTIVTTFYLGNPAPVVYLTYEMPGPGVYYVQSVHDVNGYKMWVNGVLRDSKTYASLPSNTLSFNNGAIYGIGKVSGSTAYYAGRVYLARIYNRMLSDAEVAQNFRATAGRYLFVQNNKEPVVIRDGIILDLDAGNTASYPGSGTTWTDLSGRGNNGTLTNGPTFSSELGGTISFDGTNDGIVVGNTNGFNNADLNRSFEAVFHFNNNNQSITIITARVDGGVFEQFALSITGPSQNDWANGIPGKTLSVASLSSAGWPPRIASYTLPAAGIYHVVGTCQSSELRLYVNGVLQATNTTSQTGNLGNTSKKIGVGCTVNSSNVPAGSFFPSKIYLARAYNRALTAAEVLNNYNATKGRFVTNDLDSQITTNGLVLSLDAGNITSYPGSGTTWTDTSGNGLNGTLINGPGFNSSNGGFITFDGSNDYINFNSTSTLQFLNRAPYSLECWLYVSAAPGTFIYPGLFWREGNAGSGRDGYALILARNSGGVQIGAERWTSGSSVGVYTSEIAVTDIVNKWYHVCCTYDGTNLALYLNNSLIGSTTQTTNITNTSAVLNLGRLYAANVLNGGIAQARAYNVALTAAQIQANYNATRGRFTQNVLGPAIATNGIILNLDAGDTTSYPGSGTTWTDISGSAYNATLTNGPGFSANNGGTLTLDGTNDFAQITATNAPNLLFNGTANFTIETWVYVNDIPTGRYPGLFVRENNVSPRNGYILAFQRPSTTVNIFFSRLGAGTEQSVAGPVVNLSEITNRWIHYVGTYNGTTLKLYENGQEIASGSSTVSINNTTTNIEFGQLHNFSYLNGRIAQTRAYNRALTAAEVLNNYNATKGRFTQNIVEPSLPTNGLVLHMDAGNAASYPGSGTTWTNLVGNTNGSFVNSPTFISEVGGAIEFNGSSSYVDVPHSTAYNLSSLTILAFVKSVTTNNNIYRPILSKHPSTGVRDYQFYTYNNSGTTSVPNSLHFSSDVAAFTAAIPTGIPLAGTWQQYGCYVNGSTLDYGMIVNGVKYSQGTMGAALPQRTAPIWIGRADYYTSNSAIAVVTIYNRLLSDVEIATHFNALRGRFAKSYEIDYVIVGGGGSGAGGGGGGGGGGGVVTGKITVTPGTVGSVTIGAGGAGITGNVTSNGNSGSASSFMNIVAIGGGWGATHGDVNSPAGTGGCGGGGRLTCALSPAPAGGKGRQGGDGGHGYMGRCESWPNAWIGSGGGGGGGGGSGANGGNNSGVSGIGGPGFTTNITGSNQTFAGGGGAGAINGVVNSCAGGSGGGGTGNRCSDGTAGTANTGGGGGAGGACGSPFYRNSGSGGSGIVILRMPTACYSGITTGAPTVTTSGGNTILTFNSSGSYTT